MTPPEVNFPSFDWLPRAFWSLANRLGIFPQAQLRETYMAYRKHLWTKAEPVTGCCADTPVALVKTHPALRIALRDVCVWPKPLSPKKGQEPYIVFDIFHGPIEGMTWEVLSETLMPAGPWRFGKSTYRDAAEHFLAVARLLPQVNLDQVYEYNAPDVH